MDIPELWEIIIFQLSVEDIYMVSQVNLMLHYISTSNYLWKRKFINDYGDINETDVDWKKLYTSIQTGWSIRGEKLVSFNERFISADNRHQNPIFINEEGTANIILYDKLSPFLLKYSKTIKQVSCDCDRFSILTNKGDVYAAHTGSHSVPWHCIGKAKKILSTNNYTALLSKNGKLTFKHMMHGICISSKYIIYVKDMTGNRMNLATVDKEDNVWMSGANEFGELGLGDTDIRKNPVPLNMKVKQISMGYFHTLAIDMDGEVWGWGSNMHGQLGLLSELILLPTKLGITGKYVSAGYESTLIVDNDMNLWEISGNRSLIPGIKAWKVYAGHNQHLVIGAKFPNKK